MFELWWLDWCLGISIHARVRVDACVHKLMGQQVTCACCWRRSANLTHLYTYAQASTPTSVYIHSPTHTPLHHLPAYGPAASVERPRVHAGIAESRKYGVYAFPSTSRHHAICRGSNLRDFALANVLQFLAHFVEISSFFLQSTNGYYLQEKQLDPNPRSRYTVKLCWR